MTAFNPVVGSFVGPVIGTWLLMSDRLGVAAQLVGNDHPWVAKLRDQPCQEALGGLGITACLNQDVSTSLAASTAR
jgi:hypothetical protein